MDKFIRTFLALALLTLSGSPAAIMIDSDIDANSLSGSDDVTTESGLSLDDLLSSGMVPQTDTERTLLNQAKRWARVIDNLLAEKAEGGLDAQQEKTLEGAPDRLRGYLEELEQHWGISPGPTESPQLVLLQETDLPDGGTQGSETPLNEKLTQDNGPRESVPEPSTIALLGLGLLGMGAIRRLGKSV